MKRVAGTEDDPIVEIPLVVGFRPVVVQLQQAIVIPFDIEHVRIAVPVGNVRHAIHSTITAVRSADWRIYTAESDVAATLHQHNAPSIFVF